MSVTKALVAASGAALAIVAAPGIASADPNVEAIVNSTCTYPQVLAALNAQDPGVASQIQANPTAVATLQNFVGSGPEARRQVVTQYQNVPAVQQYISLIIGVANTCNNY